MRLIPSSVAVLASCGSLLTVDCRDEYGLVSMLCLICEFLATEFFCIDEYPWSDTSAAGDLHPLTFFEETVDFFSLVTCFLYFFNFEPFVLEASCYSAEREVSKSCLLTSSFKPLVRFNLLVMVFYLGRISLFGFDDARCI